MLRFVLSLIFRGQATEADTWAGIPWCTTYDYPG